MQLTLRQVGVLLAEAWLLISLCLVPAMAKDSTKDIRLLVDLSASNKPALRRQSIESFVKHVPAGSTAGIWSFGKYVNMIVKPGVVDKKWRRQVLAKINTLMLTSDHSNLADAVETATYDWVQPAANQQRKLLLLSDGFIQVSDVARENKMERMYLQQHVLPRLKQAKVEIYVIAPGWKKDFTLLNDMATQYKGWVREAQSKNDINWAVFLGATDQKKVAAKKQKAKAMKSSKKVVKASVKPKATTNDKQMVAAKETAKIAPKDKSEKVASTKPKAKKDLFISTFELEQNYQQIQLLIEHAKGQDFELITPADKPYHAGMLAKNMTWKKLYDHDSILIDNPQKGTWKIVGIKEGDKVLVLKNPTLLIDVKDDMFFTGEDLQVKFSLLSAGQPVKLDKFSDFTLSFEHSVSGDGTLKKAVSLNRSGSYSLILKEPQPEGFHRMQASLQGHDIHLNAQKSFRVVPNPFVISTQEATEPNLKHLLELTSNTTLVDKDTLKIMASLTYPDGMVEVREFKQQMTMALPAVSHENAYEVKLTIAGNTTSNRPFKLMLDPVIINNKQILAAAQKEMAMPADKQQERSEEYMQQVKEQMKPDETMPSTMKPETAMKPTIKSDELLSELSEELGGTVKQEEPPAQTAPIIGEPPMEDEPSAVMEPNETQETVEMEPAQDAETLEIKEIPAQAMATPEGAMVDPDEMIEEESSVMSIIFSILVLIVLNVAVFFGLRMAYQRFYEQEQSALAEIEKEIML